MSSPASPPAEEDSEGQRVVSVGPSLFHPHTPQSSLACFCLLVSSFFLSLINLCSYSTLGLSWRRPRALSHSGPEGTWRRVTCSPHGAVITSAVANVSTFIVIKSHCLKIYMDNSPCRRTNGHRGMKTYSTSLIIREMQAKLQ